MKPFRGWASPVLIVATLIGAAECQPAFAAEDDYRRYDPATGEELAIRAAELRPGNIYQHMSPRWGRRVWSFYLGNGSFWHAFGEGTTQLARDFDVPWTKREAIAELQRTDPELARRVRSAVKPFRLRLRADGKWDRIGQEEVVSVYDLETGSRWENHNQRYVPVVSSYGRRWIVRHGRYVPQP